MKANRDIEFQTEYGKDGKRYPAVRKRGRLARDGMCGVIRQYEPAGLRRVAELISRNGGHFK